MEGCLYKWYFKPFAHYVRGRFYRMTTILALLVIDIAADVLHTSFQSCQGSYLPEDFYMI